MLLLGITDVVNAYLIFFGVEEPDRAVESGEATMITRVASVDHFLSATIPRIFAVGIYALLSQLRRVRVEGRHGKFGLDLSDRSPFSDIGEIDRLGLLLFPY